MFEAVRFKANPPNLLCVLLTTDAPPPAKLVSEVTPSGDELL